MKLNERQAEAVAHRDGPMMVLAGPGSGKTTVIVIRIKNLIEKYNVNPRDITVITFTKSAADEMKHRFNRIVDNNISRQVTFGTFHSVFFRIIRSALGYTPENILKDGERRDLFKKIIQEMNIDTEDHEEFLNNTLREVSLVKNELIDVRFHNPLYCGTEDFKNIYVRYEKIKEDGKKIDFDDMLVKCYFFLKERQKSLKYIMIDEFQDINRVQYECIKLLSAPLNNLFIVGDDDQSIYKFRGARPEFLLRFPADYTDTKTVMLETNYRSTNQIINLCNMVIGKNTNRYKKLITGTNKKGKSPIILKPEDAQDEAFNISKIIKAYKDYNGCAVIYRTNIQARAIVDAFMDMNIPFRIRDEAPGIYEHWVCRDIAAYLTLALDRTCKTAFERIINKPKRYINKWYIAEAQKPDGSCVHNLFLQEGLKSWQSLKVEQLDACLDVIKNKSAYDAVYYIRRTVGYDNYIREYASLKNLNPKGLFEVLNEVLEASKKHKRPEDFLGHMEDAVAEIKKSTNTANADGVTLTTMHSAKGLEFDVVFITSAIEGVIPHERSRSDEEIEEERRLFYVAMTRAKKILYISLVKTRYEEKASATRFLMIKSERKIRYE